MEKPLKQTVFLKVSCKDRMPTEEKWYFIEVNNGSIYSGWYVISKMCFDTDRAERFYGSDVKYWLEKQEDKYVLSQEDFEDALEAAFNGARETHFFVDEIAGEYVVGYKHKDFQDYLKK